MGEGTREAQNEQFGGDSHGRKVLLLLLFHSACYSFLIVVTHTHKSQRRSAATAVPESKKWEKWDGEGVEIRRKSGI